MTSEIETPRLFLRPLTEEDEEHFVKLFADPRVTRYITLTEEPMPKEWAIAALRRNLDAWHKYGYGPWSAIYKETGLWIGKIDLIIHEDWPGDDKTEVGWELDPDFWGQGLATEGGRAAIGYGFTELELPRIISVTTPDNIASWRVMEKCGLRYQGRIRWRDVDCVWYAIDSADWLPGIGRDDHGSGVAQHIDVDGPPPLYPEAHQARHGEVPTGERREVQGPSIGA